MCIYHIDAILMLQLCTQILMYTPPGWSHEHFNMYTTLYIYLKQAMKYCTNTQTYLEMEVTRITSISRRYGGCTVSGEPKSISTDPIDTPVAAQGRVGWAIHTKHDHHWVRTRLLHPYTSCIASQELFEVTVRSRAVSKRYTVGVRLRVRYER